MLRRDPCRGSVRDKRAATCRRQHGSTPFIDQSRQPIEGNRFSNLLYRFSPTPPVVPAVWNVNRLRLAALMQAAFAAPHSLPAATAKRCRCCSPSRVAKRQRGSAEQRPGRPPFPSREEKLKAAGHLAISLSTPITVTFNPGGWFAVRPDFSRAAVYAK